MPRAAASRELAASRQDVWRVVADPRRFADWWPNVASVEAGRQGLAPGARWTIRAPGQPSPFRRSGYSGTLVVLEVRPLERLSWTLSGDRIDADLRLEDAGDGDRTRAILELTAAWLVSLPRNLPRRALNRLHDLCQTAATT